MSDANLSSVAFQREVSWGVPATPIALKLLRITKESLDHKKEIQKSAEIRPDRRQGESVQVGVSAMGGVDFELSVGDLDQFLESAMFSAFADVGGVPTLVDGITRTSFVMEKKMLTSGYASFKGLMLDTLTLNIPARKIVTGSMSFIGTKGVLSTTSINGGTRATGTLTLAENVANGETVTVGGKVYTFQTTLTNVANNVKRGASASDSLENLVAAINLGAGAGTLYAAATLQNENVSAALGAGDTMVATAKTLGTAGNSIATTETLAGSGNQWGGATLSGGTETSGGGYTAAGTGLILSASANVGNIKKGAGGAALAGIKSLDLTINNNLRGNEEIGRPDIGEVGLGSVLISGRMDTYFRDTILLEELMNHDDSAIQFELTREADGASSGDLVGYRFTIPKLKWTNGFPHVDGKDTDIMLPLEFEAEVGTFNGANATMGIEKILKA